MITPISQMWLAGSHSLHTLGWARVQGQEPAQAPSGPSSRAPESQPPHPPRELPGSPTHTPAGRSSRPRSPARAGPLVRQPSHLTALSHLHRGSGSSVQTWESPCVCVCESLWGVCVCVRARVFV